MDRDAEGGGGLQRIDDVQEMRPGFGEILPRMGGGIGTDEMLLPVGGWAVPVMGLERRAIVARARRRRARGTRRAAAPPLTKASQK